MKERLDLDRATFKSAEVAVDHSEESAGNVHPSLAYAAVVWSDYASSLAEAAFYSVSSQPLVKLSFTNSGETQEVGEFFLLERLCHIDHSSQKRGIGGRLTF